MDVKRFVNLTFEIGQEIDKVNETIKELQRRVKQLFDYAEAVRQEQRNEVEVWLENTFPQLFTAERSESGYQEGYQHFLIMNNKVGPSSYGCDLELSDMSLEETKSTFKETMDKFLEEHDGKKILVRIPPQYTMTDEGNHRIRCRVHVERVNA